MTISFSGIAKRYDFLNDVISLGLHRRWKRRLVAGLLDQAQRKDVILDVATGTGDVARLFDVHCRKLGVDAEIVGLDPCEEMLDIARAKAGRTKWKQGPAEALPLPDASVDIISCAFGVRNFRDRGTAFAEWHRVLKAGGKGAVLDAHPAPSGLMTKPISFYWNHCVPLVGRVFGRKAAYEYLSASARKFVSAEELAGEIESAGFKVLKVRSVFGGGLAATVLFEKV